MSFLRWADSAALGLAGAAAGMVLAGGGGIGWGVTSELMPRRPRLRPGTAIQLNGPPFFDDRSRRAA